MHSRGVNRQDQERPDAARNLPSGSRASPHNRRSYANRDSWAFKIRHLSLIHVVSLQGHGETPTPHDVARPLLFARDAVDTRAEQEAAGTRAARAYCSHVSKQVVARRKSRRCYPRLKTRPTHSTDRRSAGSCCRSEKKRHDATPRCRRTGNVPLVPGTDCGRATTPSGSPGRTTFPAGVDILRAEQPGDVAYIVLEGTVKVQVDRPDGTAVILAILRAGEVAGEMSLIDHLVAPPRSWRWNQPRSPGSRTPTSGTACAPCRR